MFSPTITSNAQCRHCVDYFSHPWTEEDLLCSWKFTSKQKLSLYNGIRLENASWRLWSQQRNGLVKICPSKLNWDKEYDSTWLYGPLFTTPLAHSRTLSSPPSSSLQTRHLQTLRSVLKRKHTLHEALTNPDLHFKEKKTLLRAALTRLGDHRDTVEKQLSFSHRAKMPTRKPPLRPERSLSMAACLNNVVVPYESFSLHQHPTEYLITPTGKPLLEREINCTSNIEAGRSISIGNNNKKRVKKKLCFQSDVVDKYQENVVSEHSPFNNIARGCGKVVEEDCIVEYGDHSDNDHSLYSLSFEETTLFQNTGVTFSNHFLFVESSSLLGNGNNGSKPTLEALQCFLQGIHTSLIHYAFAIEVWYGKGISSWPHSFQFSCQSLVSLFCELLRVFAWMIAVVLWIQEVIV